MPLHPLVEEWDAELTSADPLRFPGYREALDRAVARARADQGCTESVMTGRCRVGDVVSPDGVSSGNGVPSDYVLIEGCFEVLGGSMGAVHGERVVRAFERATRQRLPVVVITTSGGARMQEGMVSLVQMARTAAAARQHGAAGLLSLAVYRLFGCFGFARVDLMHDEGGDLQVLEVNPIPGLTETSLLPQAAEAAGLGFDEVVERLLARARERGPAGAGVREG